MIGKIIDMDSTDAFILFPDGTTMDLSLSKLPRGVTIGTKVNIPMNGIKNSNDKLSDIF